MHQLMPEEAADGSPIFYEPQQVLTFRNRYHILWFADQKIALSDVRQKHSPFHHLPNENYEIIYNFNYVDGFGF